MKELFKKLLGKHKTWFVNNIYVETQKKLILLTQIFGSKRIVTPSNIVRSIPECCYLDFSAMWAALKSHVVDMHVIRRAGAETYQYSSELPPAFRTEMHFARRYVYRLKDVLLNPRTGACRISSHPLQESYGALRDCIENQPFPSLKARAIQLYGLGTCVHATGYYHFLLEEVPRLLWTIDRYPNINVYLSNNAPRFCRDILDSMINRRIINGYDMLKANSIVKMKDYVFTQADAYSGFVHSKDLQKMRDTFIPVSEEVSEIRNRIFISRRHSGRSFDNEAELEETLADLGYRIVYLERMSFDSQIKIMLNSQTVVATHGAGLANLAWCHPCTKIIEIFSPRYMNDCYARLSATLSLQYTPLWGTNTKKWGSVNIEQLILKLK